MYHNTPVQPATPSSSAITRGRVWQSSWGGPCGSSDEVLLFLSFLFGHQSNGHPWCCLVSQLWEHMHSQQLPSGYGPALTWLSLGVRQSPVAIQWASQPGCFRLFLTALKEIPLDAAIQRGSRGDTYTGSHHTILDRDRPAAKKAWTPWGLEVSLCCSLPPPSQSLWPSVHLLDAILRMLRCWGLLSQGPHHCRRCTDPPVDLTLHLYCARERDPEILAFLHLRLISSPTWRLQATFF